MTAWSSRELSPELLRDRGSWLSWVKRGRPNCLHPDPGIRFHQLSQRLGRESASSILVTARSWSSLLLMLLQTPFLTPLLLLTSEAGNYKSDKKFAQSLCAEKNESKLKQIVSFCAFQSKPGEGSQPQAQTLVPER